MSDWKGHLGAFFEETEKKKDRETTSELGRFITNTVLPAFEEIRQELARHGREVVVRDSGNSAALIVYRDGEEEMTYRIQGRTFPNAVLPFAEIRFRERKGLRYIRVESMFRSGSADYSISDITQGEIIRNFVDNYTSRVDGS